jgi:hypothetical protein
MEPLRQAACDCPEVTSTRSKVRVGSCIDGIGELKEGNMNGIYHEVCVEGAFDLVKGFILGLLEGRGLTGETIIAREHNIKKDWEFKDFLRRISGKEDQVRIIASGKALQAIEEALVNLHDDLDIRVLSVRRVGGAHFYFTYESYTKEAGDELKGLFANPPQGLSVSGYKVEEKVNPEGQGIEAYAPLHRYEGRGKGRVYGSVREVIAFHERLTENSLVQLEDIELDIVAISTGER